MSHTGERVFRASASGGSKIWFAPSGRVRGWIVGLVLVAMSGFLLQPTCNAWWAGHDGGQTAGAVEAQSERAVEAGAPGHPATDNCCAIEAVADHVSPPPSVAIWHDRSPSAGMAPPGIAKDRIFFDAGATSRAAYRPPNRGTPYHARSTRLLL